MHVDIYSITCFIFHRYERAKIVEERRSEHVALNVSGWISIHGVGDVTRVEGRFTAHNYIGLLQDFLLPSLRERNYPFPPGPVILEQDRCSVHMARVVSEWFAGQENLQLLDWPSKACDCNPIENIWGNMVNTWEDEEEMDTLMVHVHRVWETFRRRLDFVRNLSVLYAKQTS